MELMELMEKANLNEEEKERYRKELEEKEQLEKFFNTEIGKKSASLLANKKNIRIFAPQ